MCTIETWLRVGRAGRWAGCRHLTRPFGEGGSVGKTHNHECSTFIDLPYPVGMLLQHGTTPLHKAAGSGRKEVVGLLLRAGAAVNAADTVRPPSGIGQMGAFSRGTCYFVGLQLIGKRDYDTTTAGPFPPGISEGSPPDSGP
jgi:hypothetical protein